jgi:hypothetical protein
VRTVHKDGSATIEARFRLHGDERAGPYVGYKFRTHLMVDHRSGSASPEAVSKADDPHA